QRVLALGPVQGECADAGVELPGKVPGRVAGQRVELGAHGVARDYVVLHVISRKSVLTWSLTLPSSLCSVATSLAPRPAKAPTIQPSCCCAISWNCLRPLGVMRTRKA